MTLVFVFWFFVNPFWPWARIIYDCVNCSYGHTFPNNFGSRVLSSIATPIRVVFLMKTQMQCKVKTKDSDNTRNSFKWNPLPKYARAMVVLRHFALLYQISNNDQSHGMRIKWDWTNRKCATNERTKKRLTQRKCTAKK